MIAALMLFNPKTWRRVGPLRAFAAAALVIAAEVLVGVAVAALLGYAAGSRSPHVVGGKS